MAWLRGMRNDGDQGSREAGRPSGVWSWGPSLTGEKAAEAAKAPMSGPSNTSPGVSTHHAAHTVVS